MLMRDGSLMYFRETRDERREGVSERFRSGIRLPDEFRVDADEWYLRRTSEGFWSSRAICGKSSTRQSKNCLTGSSAQA